MECTPEEVGERSLGSHSFSRQEGLHAIRGNPKLCTIPSWMAGGGEFQGNHNIESLRIDLTGFDWISLLSLGMDLTNRIRLRNLFHLSKSSKVMIIFQK